MIDRSPEEQARKPGSHIEPARSGLHHPAHSQFSLPLPRTRNCNSLTAQRGSEGSSAINSCWSYLHSLWTWQTCTHTHRLTHVGGAVALATLSPNLNASAALTDLRTDHWAWLFHLRPTAPDLTWVGTLHMQSCHSEPWRLKKKKKKASLGSFLHLSPFPSVSGPNSPQVSKGRARVLSGTVRVQLSYSLALWPQASQL